MGPHEIVEWLAGSVPSWWSDSTDDDAGDNVMDRRVILILEDDDRAGTVQNRVDRVKVGRKLRFPPFVRSAGTLELQVN